MAEFRFYHPIEVRYGDLDPQGHLNNAKYLTYFEQARIRYLRHLGLFREGQSFLDIGIILADAHVTFKMPVEWGQAVRVGVRVSRLGNKSMTMEYRMVDGESGEELATGSSVLVTYDYRSGETIPIPDTWRETIAQFEGLEVG
ncbi:MAG: acyl-CoA thioesterase [Anaerolineae bacterium]|nr:MAG: acyl-CoA thioesterase [Anaerolineae bacterium]